MIRLTAIEKLSRSGVDLFFVSSGFLIGGILLDVKDSPHYFKTFYVRRAYRVLPLYYMAVLGIFLLRLISFRLFPGLVWKPTAQTHPIFIVRILLSKLLDRLFGFLRFSIFESDVVACS